MFPQLLKELVVAVTPNTAANLQSGFRACGILPFNPQAVLNKIPSTGNKENNPPTSSLVREAVLEML